MNQMYHNNMYNRLHGCEASHTDDNIPTVPSEGWWEFGENAANFSLASGAFCCPKLKYLTKRNKSMTSYDVITAMSKTFVRYHSVTSVP